MEAPFCSVVITMWSNVGALLQIRIMIVSETDNGECVKSAGGDEAGQVVVLSV